MKDYIEGNKEAWEEAFDNRPENWGVEFSDMDGKGFPLSMILTGRKCL